MKPKKCRVCQAEYTPARMGQKVCSPGCAIQDVQKTKRREYRKETRALKEQVKNRSQWMKEAQQAFNAYIRARDAHLPCISCERHHQGQYHAGHYRSAGGNPELRFEELNTHKQCMPCNSHLSGNLINYRINLIKKIGLGAVEWLEGPHEPKKYTIENLKEIRDKYRKMEKDEKKHNQVLT